MRTLALALLLAASGRAPQDAGTAVDFTRDVRPILAGRCITCHGGVKRKSGLSFMFREGALAPAESGKRAIVPGKPDASELLRRVTIDGDDRMPPKGDGLSKDEIATLRRWIEQGAPWEPHWAFRPLSAPDLPTVKNAGWVRNEIDRFILARLEAKGLSPSPEAGRTTLIRRIALDVTGLPPAPEELDGLRDAAYAKIVDHYLDSPAYGERWGKHWLDAAGYADSNGYFHADTDRPLAWKYRDWVIDALNRDMPFDRFIRWQLAGDLAAGYKPGADVTPDMVPKLVATHFLRNAPDGTGESDGNPDEFQRDRLIVIEGNVRNLSSALLGLTVGCAKCHDHPFEPVTQTEYYRLQALFTGIYPDDGKHWIKPQRRLIVAATKAEVEAHKKKKEPLEKEIKRLEKSLETPAREARKRLLEKQLAALDGKDRSRARKILEIPGKKRTKDQKTFLRALKIRTDPDHDALAKLDNAFAEERKKTRRRIDKVRKQIPPDLPRIAAAWDVHEGEIGHHLKKRGVYTKPGDAVKPGVPVSIVGEGYAYEMKTPGGRRGALARWITSPRHPLLARVTANRVWQDHFGAGIVRTPENLGNGGLPPSHPALLTWLAARFVEDGWSLKALHRLILTSATYRQASGLRKDPYAADPENRLRWRGSLRRLDAESVRDGMLAVSGLLDRRRGGPYVPTKRWNGTVIVDRKDPGARRRSVYLQHRRTQQLTMLNTFDAPPIISNCTQRTSSTVPLQSLALLNSAFARDCAKGFATRIRKRETDPIRRAFRLAIGRPPTKRERAAAERFLAKQKEIYAGRKDAEARARTDFCQMLLASSAFLYIE